MALGEKIGRALQGGQFVELTSDLGGGKTLMVQGIAKGLGYQGDVASPTFTLSRNYRVRNDLELRHLDFYRIHSGDVVTHELAEVLGDPRVVVAIEWAEKAGEVLPPDRLRITIQTTGDTERKITVEALGSNHQKIIEALQ